MPFRPLFFALLLFAPALTAYAQNPVITGKYEGTFEIQGLGTLTVSADIRDAGGKLSGMVHTPLGDAEIIRGSYAPGSVSFTIDGGGDDVFLEGKVGGDGSLSGSVGGMVSGNPVTGTFELRRVADLPSQADLAPLTRQSKDKWREDLRYLAAELPRKHKDAFNHISKERFDLLVSQLDARLPELSDDEIILGLDRIGSSIGDGHTGVVWTSHFPRLPIRLFWFGKELRVTQVGKEYPKLIGARVTKINGTNVEKIYEAGRPFIAQNESEEYVLDTSAFLMTYPVFLKSTGAGRSVDSVKLEYVRGTGKKSSAVIKPAQATTKIEWLDAYTAAPLYLRNVDAPFYFEYLKEAETVYVNFKWYPRRAEFRKFSTELFSFLDANDVQKLVFDFRLNGGGDFTRGRDYFVKPIKERKRYLERGRLFVIVGRRTFSAGMSNAADFRNELGAVVVGEPTGARPNGYQENRSFTLPNSRLKVSYSVEFYKFSEDDTPGIIPDKIIRPDWDSYAAGRDLALEWIVKNQSFK